MSTKIIAWSARCSLARTCGVQLPRWYNALVPNSAASDSAKQIAATWAAAPSLIAMSAAPAGSDAKNAP